MGGNAATDAANNAANDTTKFGDFTADEKNHREKLGARDLAR